MITPKYIRVKEAAGSGYTIDQDSVSRTSWGQVDKTRMKNKLANDKANNVPDVNKAIREIYAIVGSVSDKNSWKYPHHILRGNTVILNVHGLASAAGYLAQDNSSPVDLRQKAARHLRKHYRKLEQTVPEGLQAVLESVSGNQHAEELISWLDKMENTGSTGSVDTNNLASLV